MDIRTLGIVGGGQMGKSIAEKVASNGIDVIVAEISEDTAAAAQEELVANLDEELEKWGITETDKKVVLSRVRFVADLESLAETDMVIESVPEDLEAKRRVMRQLGEICPAERIFMTNTSTLSITEIAAASGRPERVAGMHFLYPVTLSPLVELIRGIETSDETMAAARDLAGLLGKEVVEVFEYPGYVVTRAMIPLLNEAMHIVMEGVSSAEDVDKAVRLGYDFKMGPLEYSDRVGLDKVLSWMEHLFRELGDMKYRPCPLLRQMVRAGHLGRKTGKGFFEYPEAARRRGRTREPVR
jgi:3-hydroxybutyryl-CoA dehydrogenase